jgi:hypothetical protein
MQAKNPIESYQALAKLGKSYYDQSIAANKRLEAQVGTPEQIGQRNLDRNLLELAAYQGSLPSQASPELQDVTKGLLAKAKARSAAGPAAGASEPGYEAPGWVYGQTEAELNKRMV